VTINLPQLGWLLARDDLAIHHHLPVFMQGEVSPISSVGPGRGWWWPLGRKAWRELLQLLELLALLLLEGCSLKGLLWVWPSRQVWASEQVWR
jgi:hypothetical protein